MQKPEATEYHQDYEKYVDYISIGSYQQLMPGNTTEVVDLFTSIPSETPEYLSAEAKWTIKEVLMHINDTERVFSYRALAAARGDTTPVYRMDEELYARNVDVSNRAMSDLISEFSTVRSGTEFLFK